MFNELKKAIQKLVSDRDWGGFHTPKNLAINLSVEASELLEQFTWHEKILDDAHFEAVKQEIGDIFISLILLSDRLGVDLFSATFEKLKLIEKKYPVDLSKGKATKYDKL